MFYNNFKFIIQKLLLIFIQIITLNINIAFFPNLKINFQGNSNTNAINIIKFVAEQVENIMFFLILNIKNKI